MALLANRTQVGVGKIGGTVAVADDPRARLMFYLKCMCDVLDLDQPNLNRLIDYQNYHCLTTAEIDALIKLCFLISPDELNGKCIFEDEDNEVCGEKLNQFVAVSAVQSRVLATENILIGNQVKHVKKVMFYKRAWIVRYYVEPIVQLKITLDVVNLEAAAQLSAIQRHQQQLTLTYHQEEQPRPKYKYVYHRISL